MSKKIPGGKGKPSRLEIYGGGAGRAPGRGFLQMLFPGLGSIEHHDKPRKGGKRTDRKAPGRQRRGRYN